MSWREEDLIIIIIIIIMIIIIVWWWRRYLLDGSLRGRVGGLGLPEQLQDLLEPLAVRLPLALHLGRKKAPQKGVCFCRPPLLPSQ